MLLTAIADDDGENERPRRDAFAPRERRYFPCCGKPDTCLCEVDAVIEDSIRAFVATMPHRYTPPR